MRRTGLFCVHGFLEDGEHSFSFLKAALKQHNIKNFYMTDLQGHSKSEDINSFNYKKCLIQVEDEYVKFKSEHDDTYVLGFSMGGVIAGHLASKYGARKMVLVSPAFKYGQRSQMAKDFVALMNRTRDDENLPSIFELFNFKRGDKLLELQEFVNKEYKELGASYENFLERLSKLKMSTFINFVRLVASVKKKMVINDIPTRIFHAEFDELVPISSSLYAFSRIKSEDKRLTLVAGVHHRILASKIKDEIIKEIVDFLYGDDYFIGTV